jgi:mevalonate kinase
VSAAAQAPGKVILFGEHAINRGQPAIAAAISLYARCQVEDSDEFTFAAGDHMQKASRESILHLTTEVDRMRKAEAFDEIRLFARTDYFAPQKFILGKMFGSQLPRGLSITWESEIPSCSGLGSGAAAFTSMIAAIIEHLGIQPLVARRAEWAQFGDVVAHGGVASGLDTQTSLLGGVVRYTGQGLAVRLACAPGACVLVAHCGVTAATSEVNTRVRLWLAEKPNSRIQYFQMIGALSRAAVPLLAKGDWDELGRLMNLNHLVLEKIGVSCPEIDCLIEAALAAGAFGAKISGSGGGGIIIVLAPVERREMVVQALRAKGAKVMMPEIGVEGAKVTARKERELPATV